MAGGDGAASGRRGWFGRTFGRRHGAVPWHPADLVDREAVAAHPAGRALGSRPGRNAGRMLAAEAEAYLAGRYAERLSERSTPVPAWAWANVLAHGTGEDVRRVARGLGTGSSVTHGWRAARAYLATELLRTAERSGSLEALQRAVMVPIELELAAQRDARTWTPQGWVAAVRAALSVHRHTHQT